MDRIEQLELELLEKRERLATARLELPQMREAKRHPMSGPQKVELDRLIAENEAVVETLPDEIASLDQQLREARAVHGDEHTFWNRRFHTSLAIAHGGGLLAVGNKLIDPAAGQTMLQVGVVPMAIFAGGLVAAGYIPLALAHGQQRRARQLVTVSAGLFAGGLVVVLGCLVLLAWPRLADPIRYWNMPTDEAPVATAEEVPAAAAPQAEAAVSAAAAEAEAALAAAPPPNAEALFEPPAK
ncbi:hypothetical protein [Phenylobacterium sp.]|uniref:hypothetical protein n=1 Tax=Phenylobacterium sp. TaxID=1871053 RepID=UPI00395B1F00